ncbi:hypothetical protein FA10DRAFT_287277 [Acaromyces ingoldii]|uniref:CHCH domain-containing protein n=1 Tax=Acaromyces ingoldii TaxID=215250 RepID=A0A316YJK4_9BASI|nr:hypothetical protein FA10DRAFT_287277 [Acaromyces ingoldii]PWN89399.1 hypothetical protein FA10DRAFT_287277 [Acaromyces ingoldii]
MASSRPSQPQHQPAPHANQAQTPMQQQQQRGPGLFGQMASTAAGVAVGSSVGHGLSNMFFGGGGSSQEPAPAPDASVSNAGYGSPSNPGQPGMSCEVQSKDFLRCLDATNNDMNSCAFYLDQLKACQAAARPY